MKIDIMDSRMLILWPGRGVNNKLQTWTMFIQFCYLNKIADKRIHFPQHCLNELYYKLYLQISLETEEEVTNLEITQQPI